MLLSLANTTSASGCDREKYDNLSIGNCLRADLQTADGELTAILEKLKKGFWNVESLESLNQAQAAWNKFVELDCKFQKPQTGGREWWFGHTSCILGHKRERIRQLKEIPSCGNGCIWQGVQ